MDSLLDFLTFIGQFTGILVKQFLDVLVKSSLVCWWTGYWFFDEQFTGLSMHSLKVVLWTLYRSFGGQFTGLLMDSLLIF